VAATPGVPRVPRVPQPVTSTKAATANKVLNKVVFMAPAPDGFFSWPSVQTMVLPGRERKP
jgi:hypothetical protein